MGTHTLLLLGCTNTEPRTEVRVPRGHPACKHGAGPGSRRLVSPYPVSAPRQPLPGPVLFRGQDGAVRGVRVTGRGAEGPRVWEGQVGSAPLAAHSQYIPLPPLPSRCQSGSTMPCPEPVGRGRLRLVGCVQLLEPRGGRQREVGALTVLAAWAREAGGTEAEGALAGAPM